MAKEGPGRLYYRIGLDYAPKNLKLDAADCGFIVERTYHHVNHPEDVKKKEDGTWLIKAGATVKITLTLTAKSTRYHVALVDKLPAGKKSSAITATWTFLNSDNIFMNLK